MNSYTLVINGVSHKVSFKNGKKVYDPPLSNSEKRGKIKDILSSRKFPGVSTDTTFLSGLGTLEKQFGGDTEYLEKITNKARSEGLDVNPNMAYIPTLAKYPGDPKAFIPPGEGKGYVRRLCEERGWSCTGAVNVKGREPSDDPHKNPKYKLHPRIVKEEVAKMKKAGAKGDDKELAQEVIKKKSIHGG